MALTTNLTHYWKFDETSGDVIYDSVGTDHLDATAGLTINQSGIIEKSVTGGGSSGGTNPFSGNVHSISFWLKTPTVTTLSLINQYQAANYGLRLRFEAGNIELRFGTGAAYKTFTWSDHGLTGDSLWHHIVITFDLTVAHAILYVDGSQKSTQTQAAFSADYGGTYFDYILYPTTTGVYFDEWGVWDTREISSSEVTQLYNSGEGLQYPFTPQKFLRETLRLNDIKYSFPNKSLTDGLNLGDDLNPHLRVNYTATCSETVNSGDSITAENLHHLFKADLTELLNLNDAYGKPDQIFVYVYDATNSKYVEVEGCEYFKVTKRLNQMSLFEIDLPQIEADQKLYVKEFAKVLLISNNKLILKGRIQKVTYETTYSAKIEGYGMEAVIQDKEYKNATRNPDDEDRVQYSSVSAQTIAKELLSTNSDGVTPWTMEPRTSGLFHTDYGQISMRFEYANKLTALANLAENIGYEWWVDEDPMTYANDYFNIATLKGNQTDPSTDANRQFTISGANTNADGTDYQKDITNVSNYVKIIGYGDGINQLFTVTYNASPIWSTLSADISSTDVTIPVTDTSSFAASGTVRIAQEIITYTGKTSTTLTGCTRGTSSTVAKIHRNGCYLEKNVAYTSPEANSSLSDIGLMELTLSYKEIRDESTLELIASRELIERKDAIERITLTPVEPQTAAETLATGDLISITDAESGISGNYRIVGIVYENNYGNLDVSLEASNRSLTFIEQMQKEREANQALQKYMQGATNLLNLTETSEGDTTNYINIRFFLPEDVVAINKVLLNFKMKPIKQFNNIAQSSTATVNEQLTTSMADISSSHVTVNLVAGQKVLILFNLSINIPSIDSVVNWGRVLLQKGGSNLPTSPIIAGCYVYDGVDFASPSQSNSISGSYLDTISSSGSVTYSLKGQITDNSTGSSSLYGSFLVIVFNNGFQDGTLTDPSVDVYIGEDEGTMTLKGTYTADQSNLDITSLIQNIGVNKWVDIQFRPNQEMKVEANAYLKIFIESK